METVLRRRQEGQSEAEEEEEEEDEEEHEAGDKDSGHDDEVSSSEVKSGDKREATAPVALKRQTLLFTATGLESKENQRVLQKSFLTKKQAKRLKLQGTVQGLATNCSLPIAIKE